MPKISVIVPIYNREKCLGWCLSSILAQTFRDFELLLVDDGSSDRSLEICNNYASIDKRVRVFSKPNGGVSSARNFGLQKAQGAYIQFIDSDDWIPPQMLERLLGAIELYEADIAFCGIKIVRLPVEEKPEITLLSSSCLGEECVWSRKMVWERMAYLFWLTSYMEGPCNRLYRKSVIDSGKLHFPEDMSYGEDCVFNLYYYDLLERAVFLRDLYYYYLWHPEASLARRHQEQFFENQMRQVHLMLALMKKNHALNTENYRCWANYCVGQTMKAVMALLRKDCRLSDEEKKRQLALIVQNDDVHNAFQNCNFDFGRNAPIREMIVQGNVGGVWNLLFAPALPEPSPAAEEKLNRTPGAANRWLVKLMRILQKIPAKRVKKTACLLEQSLMNVGIKETAKMTWKKLFSSNKSG